MSKRNQYTAEQKTNIVLEVLREEQTVNEIAAKYGVHPNMLSRWKQEFLERVPEVFKRGMSDAEKQLREEKERVAQLERKVGQLTYEVDWLKKNLTKSSDRDVRQRIISKKAQISVKRQAELLEVPRTGAYRQPRREPVISGEDLHIMRLIDRYHTDHPTWGYRTIASLLRQEHALVVYRKKVRRLMRDMGIYVIYPKPNSSKRYHAEHVRPYLLRKLEITKPDQVWGVDITYLHLHKGFMYLFVIIDWYSRCVVDYELSSTLDKGFVLACLKRAFSKSKPDIMNSDQGGHFTNPDYIRLLESEGVRISMDGKGQCLDNARTERFFRTLKYDTIYIHEVDSPRELRAMMDKFIYEYNTLRPHSSLQGKRPIEVYNGVPCRRIA